MSTKQNSLKFRDKNGNPGNSFKLSYDEPTECPICKASIKPHFHYGFSNHQTKMAFLFFECPSCLNCFILTSAINVLNNSEGNQDSLSAEARLAPFSHETRTFSKIIDEVSPSFVEIYNEALFAESSEINRIAGVGFRKALEFLVKDYLLKTIRDETIRKSIPGMNLSKCIKDHVNHPKLKAIAQRAVWLGNDETHYQQLFVDKDIAELKQLIDLCVHWIDLDLGSDEAIQNIQPQK